MAWLGAGPGVGGLLVRRESSKGLASRLRTGLPPWEEWEWRQGRSEQPQVGPTTGGHENPQAEEIRAS